MTKFAMFLTLLLTLTLVSPALAEANIDAIATLGEAGYGSVHSTHPRARRFGGAKVGAGHRQKVG